MSSRITKRNRKRTASKQYYLFGSIKSYRFQKRIFIVLFIIAAILGTLTIAQARGLLIPKQPLPAIDGNVVYLDSLNLEQKIGQMIITHGGLHNLEPWKRMNIGGIHLFAMAGPDLFKETINTFQKDMQIPFFVTADLEGCLSPFTYFRNFTFTNKIHDEGEAFEKGRIEGEFLSNLGFSINFAPVVDLDDQIWGCRSFPGDEKQIAELAEAYILGLQSKSVLATAKHYPGKALVIKDPHKDLVSASIVNDDLYPYEYLAENNQPGAVMVTHVIAFGEADSGNVPSVAAVPLLEELQDNFESLIITDDTMMLGLRKFYPTVDEMYLAVFKAENDMVINFDEDPNEIYRMIQIIKKAVESGEILEERIDNSVRKILTAKKFEVR